MAIELIFFFTSFEQFLPAALCSLYLILFNVFLLRSSLKNEREFPRFSLLKITSIINIVLAGIIFVLPRMSRPSPWTESEMWLFLGYEFIFRSLIYTIPQIFTIGLTLFLIGSKYKSQMGPFMRYSGIFWMVFFIWASISLYNPQGINPLTPNGLDMVLDYLHVFEVFDLYRFTIFMELGFIFNILGCIFFIVHSYSNNDKNLKIAGFAYVIGTAITGLGIIPDPFK